MRNRLGTLTALAACLFAGTQAVAQPGSTAPAKKESVFSTLTGASRSLIARRAKFFYRMPDGTYWDGWNYVQCRRVLDESLYAERIVERGTPSGGPGVSFREDKVVGVEWLIRKTPAAAAWGFDRDEKGEIPTIRRADGRRLGEDDVEQDVIAILPKGYSGDVELWTCVDEDEPRFVYIDETNPDMITRRAKRGYLEVKAVLDEGTYRIEGRSLEKEHIDGVVTVRDPRRFVNKQWFKGEFFLWPAGGKGDWQLLPAEELRVTPEELAEAVMSGAAEIAEWKYEKTDTDTYLWTRTVREIVERPEPLPARPREPKKRTQEPPPLGRDVLILTTGEYYEGKLISQSDAEVVFLTMVGGIKTELRIERHRVSTVQDFEDDK